MSLSPSNTDVELEMEDEEATITTATVKKRKTIKPRSKVWEEFIKLETPKGSRPKAKCKHCKATFNCDPRSSGTSGMLRHIKKSCRGIKRGPNIVDALQRRITHDASTASGLVKGNIMIEIFDEKRTRRLLAEFIIQAEQPLMLVENPGFIKFVRGLEPRFRMISRRTVTRDCMGVYVAERTKLMSQLKELNPRVSLTTDTWTSIQNITYMCVTAHLIDTNWVLHKRVLGFRKIVGHTGIALSMVMEQVLKDWGIDKVLTITVDNASANDTCLSELRKNMLNLDLDLDIDAMEDYADVEVDKELLDELRHRQIDEYKNVKGGVLLGHDNLHMRCSAHILNLIVQDGLKELDRLVVKMRTMVKYVKSSPQREEYFLSYVAQIDEDGSSSNGFLQLDVCTRWNSTYTMLQSVEKNQTALQKMLVLDDGLRGAMNERGKDGKRVGPGLPTNSDWERIKTFISFLKIFYEATVTFSASDSCTAQLFFKELYNLKRHLNTFMESGDPFIRTMAKRMHKKYVKYWGEISTEPEPSLRLNRFLFVATVLHPSCKICWFEVWLSKMIPMEESITTIELVKKTMEDLFLEYHSLYGEFHSGQQPSSSTNAGDDPNFDEWVQMMASTQSNTKTELDMYLLAGVVPLKGTILEWWKTNEARYPVLAKMARDVLAIPVSTVASESVFSTGGRILNPFRSSLSPGTVETLICTQNWLRGNNEICYPDQNDGTEDLEFETNAVYKEMKLNPEGMLEGINSLHIRDRVEDIASCS